MSEITCNFPTQCPFSHARYATEPPAWLRKNCSRLARTCGSVAVTPFLTSSSSSSEGSPAASSIDSSSGSGLGVEASPLMGVSGTRPGPSSWPSRLCMSELRKVSSATLDLRRVTSASAEVLPVVDGGRFDEMDDERPSPRARLVD